MVNEHADSPYIKNGSLLFSEIDKTFKSLEFDTAEIKGYIINNVANNQEIAYKMFVIDQMINYDEFNPMIDNGITIEASTLLLDQYRCPNNYFQWENIWYILVQFQCPSSGDCIHYEKQCDGYADCSEGLDEDPRQIITNCCDEFILSGVDSLSAFWYHKYMGTYEKVECTRY